MNAKSLLSGNAVLVDFGAFEAPPRREVRARSEVTGREVIVSFDTRKPVEVVRSELRLASIVLEGAV